MLRFLQWLIALEWPARRLDRRFGAFNPFLPAHRRDPHATWRRLRESQPVYQSPVFRAWLVTRYDDAAAVLRDRRFAADRSDTALMRWISFFLRRDGELRSMIERNLLNLDPPDHTRLRGLVSKAFTPRRVERLRPRVEALVEELLDRLAPRAECELIGDLARPLPVQVIAELLGVPTPDRQRLREWSEGLVLLLDPFQGRGGLGPARRATRALHAIFRPLLAERRAAPRDDLLSAMIEAEEDGERLSEADLVALASLLLVAGHETTTNLIGNAVVALLRHPDERKRLADDPGLIGRAVDELLRWDGPVQMTERVAREDLELGGRRIRKGQFVWPVLAAANRDPARFPDAERLDLGRRENPHLAFGLGAHFCLGSKLARLEAEVALAALVRRFPRFEGPTEPPAWRRSMILRGPEALPLRLA